MFYPVSAQGSFIETFHALVSNDLENLIHEKAEVQYGGGYLSKNEKYALQSLKKYQQIVIRSAEKGVGGGGGGGQ